MAKRAAHTVMKIRIHPLFILLLLGIVFTGNIAYYSVIVVSLLVHELGHLIAAKLVGAEVERCILMPYGGEITLKNEFKLTYKQLILIALGGPAATLLGLGAALLLPDILSATFITFQLILLTVNLIPLWPLDGGRVLCYYLLQNKPNTRIFEGYLSISLSLLTIIIIVLLYLLPQSLSFVLIGLFLWGSVIGEWKNRKYRSAFEKIVMNRLT